MIDFNKLIDAFLSRELKEKKPGRYYPSEIGGCLRKTWFSYKDPRETGADLVRVFQAGNLVHDFVADVLRSEKNPDVVLLKEEMPFEITQDGFIISGRIDDLVLLKIEGRKVLVEVKSTSSLAYVNEPSEAYVMQLQLYMHQVGVHDGMILYIEKNTLQAKWFNVGYDKDIAMDTIERFQVLHESLINDEMPEAESKIDEKKSWLCKSCQWKDKCL